MARIRSNTLATLAVTDPDLVALWSTKSPEGRAMLETLQRGRDRNRSAQFVKSPPPNSSMYEEDAADV